MSAAEVAFVAGGPADSRVGRDFHYIDMDGLGRASRSGFSSGFMGIVQRGLDD
jgi:hypothetical protein